MALILYSGNGSDVYKAFFRKNMAAFPDDDYRIRVARDPMTLEDVTRGINEGTLPRRREVPKDPKGFGLR